MNLSEQKKAVEGLKKGDENALKAIFTVYYGSLCHYASKWLNDPGMAEEIVQDLFVRLWEKREVTDIDSSLKSYLFRSVHNQCINQLRHRRVRKLHAMTLNENQYAEDTAENYHLEKEISSRIQAFVDKLPLKRREIFRLSREEGLKYHEIASRLQISVKTVETQMGLAIKSLRESLKHFLMLFLM